MRVLPRGNWMDESGPEVVPAVPVFLAQGMNDAKHRLGRRDLANWIVSPSEAAFRTCWMAGVVGVTLCVAARAAIAPMRAASAATVA